MNYSLLKRREFIQFCMGVGLIGLVGCSKKPHKAILRSSKGIFPQELLDSLPSSWRFENMSIDSDIDPYKFALKETTDLLILQDGWLGGFSSKDLLPLDATDIFGSLGAKASDFLDSFDADYETKILPIGVSPWVMIFRNGDPWIARAKESWDVLLDSSLKDQIILPNSPRLVMSLVEKMGSQNQLKKLRRSVKTYDDVNALNWISSGQARVVILPLQRCISSLIKDPRLSVVLPKEGAPLNWTVLVRPISSEIAMPLSWVKESWRSPLLDKLLVSGWIPPLPFSEFSKNKIFIRKDLQSVILPSRDVWANSWSLSPISDQDQKESTQLWIDSTP